MKKSAAKATKRSTISPSDVRTALSSLNVKFSLLQPTEIAEILNCATTTYINEIKSYQPLTPTKGLKVGKSIQTNAIGILKAVGLWDDKQSTRSAVWRAKVQALPYDYKRILSAGQMTGEDITLITAIERVIAFCNQTNSEYESRKSLRNSARQEDTHITHFLYQIFRIYALLHNNAIPAINTWVNANSQVVNLVQALSALCINAMGNRVIKNEKNKLHNALTAKALASRIEREPQFLKKSIRG